MNIYQRQKGNKTEIAVDEHIDEGDFVKLCHQKGFKIEPGSVKLIYEAMRYKNRKIEFNRCDSHISGAYKLTIGILEDEG